MKKKILLILLGCLFVCCTLGVVGCFGNSDDYSSSKPDAILIYHLNGGELAPGAAHTVNEDGTVEREYILRDDSDGTINFIDVERETWIFDGWYTDSGFENKFEKLNKGKNETVHLYAKWTDKITVTRENFKEYFSVKSNWNGGLNVGNAAVYFSFEPKYTLDPARCEDEILISATPKLGTWGGRTIEVTLTADIDYSYYASQLVTTTAEFQLGAPTLNYEVRTSSVDLYLLHKDPIKVTFDVDGGTLENEVIEVAGGNTLKRKDLPTPVKTGYRFINWYADGQFKEKFDDKKITRETTVYAKFEKEVVITFDTKGGTAKETQVYLKGEGLSLGDNPTKEGYGFYGWYTDEEYTKLFNEIGAKESLTLYARWEPVRTVTFDTHGGTSKEPLKVLNTTVLTEKELGDDPTKNDLIFECWFTDSDYTKKYNGEPITEDTTLHARWCYEYTNFEYHTDEEIEKFFNVNMTSEQVEVTEGGYKTHKRVTKVLLELKEEFRNFAFDVTMSVGVYYKGPNNEDWGGGSSGRFYIDGDSPEYEFEDYVESRYGGYNADHIDLKYYCSWSRIYFPEGYVVP